MLYNMLLKNLCNKRRKSISHTPTYLKGRKITEVIRVPELERAYSTTYKKWQYISEKV